MNRHVGKIASGVAVLLLLVAWTVWPTPWRYDKAGGAVVRTNRITGTAERLKGTGWEEAQVADTEADAFKGLSPMNPVDLANIEVSEVKREVRLGCAAEELRVTIYNGSSREVRAVDVLFLARLPITEEEMQACGMARDREPSAPAPKPVALPAGLQKAAAEDPEWLLRGVTAALQQKRMVAASESEKWAATDSPYWGAFRKRVSIPSKGSVVVTFQTGPSHPSLLKLRGNGVEEALAVAVLRTAYTDRVK